MRTHLELAGILPDEAKKLYECDLCVRFGFLEEFGADYCKECEQEKCDHEFDVNEGGLCLKCGKQGSF